MQPRSDVQGALPQRKRALGQIPGTHSKPRPNSANCEAGLPRPRSANSVGAALGRTQRRARPHSAAEASLPAQYRLLGEHDSGTPLSRTTPLEAVRLARAASAASSGRFEGANAAADDTLALKDGVAALPEEAEAEPWLARLAARSGDLGRLIDEKGQETASDGGRAEVGARPWEPVPSLVGPEPLTAALVGRAPKARGVASLAADQREQLSPTGSSPTTPSCCRGPAPGRPATAGDGRSGAASRSERRAQSAGSTRRLAASSGSRGLQLAIRGSQTELRTIANGPELDVLSAKAPKPGCTTGERFRSRNLGLQVELLETLEHSGWHPDNKRIPTAKELESHSKAFEKVIARDSDLAPVLRRVKAAYDAKLASVIPPRGVAGQAVKLSPKAKPPPSTAELRDAKDSRAIARRLAQLEEEGDELKSALAEACREDLLRERGQCTA